MRAVIYAVSLATLAACAASTGLARCDAASRSGQVCARLGEEFDVRVGETAHIAGTRFSLRVDSVPEDSRCPRDAVCVWAGNARVVLALRDGESTDRAEVNSTLEPHAATRWGYHVQLVRVQPEALAGQAIAQREYRIRLLVNRSS